jgi:hypothetical protein
MNSGRNVLGLFILCFLVVWLPTSDAFAATVSISDVTDFITRLGGYLFRVDGPANNTYYYWVQVSYAVNPSGGGQNPSGGGQNPSGSGQNPSGGGSNITKIVMTKFPRAAVQKISGTGTSTAPTSSSSITNQLSPCAVENYTVETVTFDLRDIRLSTPIPTPERLVLVGDDGRPIDFVDDDGKPIVIDGKPAPKQIWAVVLQTTSKAPFIRQNIQKLPPNCPPVGNPGNASMKQNDLAEYQIYFADSSQASRFVQLLNNAIPTLNPPVLIPPPPK